MVIAWDAWISFYVNGIMIVCPLRYENIIFKLFVNETNYKVSKSMRMSMPSSFNIFGA